MKQYTAASCFSTFLLPYVLFEDVLETRKTKVKVCSLGRNISLFPDIAQREEQIDMVWKTIEAANQESPPPGLQQGFKEELRKLTAKKQDLFPWLIATIPRAELSQKGTRDVLTIETTEGVEKIQIVTHPDPMGLPRIIDILREIQKNTKKQVLLMERAMGTKGVFNDLEIAKMTTTFCVQRADLIGYHRMLTVWRETQSAPSVMRVIGHGLEVLNEIEANTKKVLKTLVKS